jgi:GNAT superfamily N-acetyltransferase
VAIEIRELSYPDAPGATGWDAFVAGIELGNLFTREDIGGTDLDATPEQVLPQTKDPYSVRRTLQAWDGEDLVGHASLGKDHDHSTCWVDVGVLASHRGQGLGSRLAESIIELARGVGAQHTDFDTEPRLPSPAGVGSVPAGAASTRFLQRFGFKLGQVEIESALDLPVPDELLDRLESASRPAPDYELVHWAGSTPDDLVDEYARLRTIASTAVPTGDLTEEEQVWDADRVRNRDRRHIESGNTVITTAARHRSSGEFVAFTSLAYPNAADGRAVGQGYTMVLPDHRGHNLGMRVKINNLRLLADRTHGARRIVTGNAGENDAMLSINRALGFRPAWISGWWEKKLGS